MGNKNIRHLKRWFQIKRGVEKILVCLLHLIRQNIIFVSSKKHTTFTYISELLGNSLLYLLFHLAEETMFLCRLSNVKKMWDTPGTNCPYFGHIITSFLQKENYIRHWKKPFFTRHWRQKICLIHIFLFSFSLGIDVLNRKRREKSCILLPNTAYKVYSMIVVIHLFKNLKNTFTLKSYELSIWNVHKSHVMSCVMCHVSHVTFFVCVCFNKLVKIVKGRCVINQATPSSLYNWLKMTF